MMPHHEGQQQGKLNYETDEIGDNYCERHHQSREINLAEYGCIGDECSRDGGEGHREIGPESQPSHVEDGRMHPVGGDHGHPVEKQQEHQRGEDWLDQIPQRTKDSLLVLRDEIAFYEQQQQIAITPNLSKIKLKPVNPVRDHQIPSFIIRKMLIGGFHDA